MPTYTIDADTTFDYLVSTDFTYSVARSGGGAVVPIGTSGAQVGQTVQSPGLGYYCLEAFLSFDTSAVVGTPTSCELSLYAISGDTLAALYNNFTVEARLYDWGSTVTSGDFIPGASLGSHPLVATCDAGDFTVADGYVPFAENGSDFIDNLNLAGTTHLVISSSRHRLGTVPGVGSYPGPGTRGTSSNSTEQIVFRELTGISIAQLVIETQGGGWGVGYVRMGGN